MQTVDTAEVPTSRHTRWKGGAFTHIPWSRSGAKIKRPWPQTAVPSNPQRISQNQKAKYAIISCFVLCMVLVTRVYTKNGCDTKVLSSSLSPPSLFIAARITAADLGWIDSPKTHDHPFGLGPNRSVRNIREVYAKGQIPRPEDQMGNVRRGGESTPAVDRPCHLRLLLLPPASYSFQMCHLRHGTCSLWTRVAKCR